MIASGKGHTEVVKLLVEHGDININYQTVAGITALHLASQYGHIHIVKILLESGADSRLVDSESETAHDRAFRHGHHDIVRLLASISATDTGFSNSFESTHRFISKQKLPTSVDENYLSVADTHSQYIARTCPSILGVLGG